MSQFKPMGNPQSELKIIQREIKAFNLRELHFDVYCDRLNFIGSDHFPLATYCDNRGIRYDRDRAGYSIDLRDAEKMGLPVKVREKIYTIYPDCRRKVH